MSPPADLARLLAGVKAILLDFDGPVCSIFAGYPASVIAAELRSLLTSCGVELPTSIVDERDPLEVLRWTATLDRPALTKAVEDALRAAELQAARVAEPTPHARDVLVAAQQSGRRMAIVSNNSEPAISAYLGAHKLDEFVALVVGRVPYEPAKMKPNPTPILEAASALGVEPSACVLIGDSVSDIRGAHAAGLPVIAYANKPPKVERFQRADADAVVTTMAAIETAMLSSASG